MFAELSEQEFEQTLSNSSLPVLVDFWADWCEPCHAFAPVLEAFAEEFAGKLAFYKFNVDEGQGIISRFSIRAIPTVIVFKNREVAGRITGILSRNDLLELIEKALG
jgi:thioredoxin 1